MTNQGSCDYIRYKRLVNKKSCTIQKSLTNTRCYILTDGWRMEEVRRMYHAFELLGLFLAYYGMKRHRSKLSDQCFMLLFIWVLLYSKTVFVPWWTDTQLPSESTSKEIHIKPHGALSPDLSCRVLHLVVPDWVIIEGAWVITWYVPCRAQGMKKVKSPHAQPNDIYTKRRIQCLIELYI